jgi:hypothetical protein
MFSLSFTAFANCVKSTVLVWYPGWYCVHCAIDRGSSIPSPEPSLLKTLKHDRHRKVDEMMFIFSCFLSILANAIGDLNKYTTGTNILPHHHELYKVIDRNCNRYGWKENVGYVTEFICILWVVIRRCWWVFLKYIASNGRMNYEFESI